MIRVSDILTQKFTEIKSRLPAAIKSFDTSSSFQEYLSDSLETTTDASPSVAASSEEKSSDNVTRAKAALQSSTGYVPSDKNKLMDLINSNLKAASDKYGIDFNLLKAVTKLESGFNPYAISSAGAQGLMQLMPGTAEGLGVTDPFDIGQNIDGGARYLKNQLVNFGGNTELALAAYNAGPYSVKKYNGIPPYKQTQNYVRNVMYYYRQYNESGI